MDERSTPHRVGQRQCQNIEALENILMALEMEPEDDLLEGTGEVAFHSECLSTILFRSESPQRAEERLEIASCVHRCIERPAAKSFMDQKSSNPIRHTEKRMRETKR